MFHSDDDNITASELLSFSVSLRSEIWSHTGLIPNIRGEETSCCILLEVEAECVRVRMRPYDVLQRKMSSAESFQGHSFLCGLRVQVSGCVD